MTEPEYIREIVRQWPESGRPPSPGLVSLLRLAVCVCPHSARLWCLKGDLHQLQSIASESRFNLQLAMTCYERAVSLDDYLAEAHNENYLAEAHNEIGYLCDVYLDDFVRAEAAFRKAIELGLDHTPYLGLARVLAETGRRAEALSLLDQSPFADHPDVAELRIEISDGVWG